MESIEISIKISKSEIVLNKNNFYKNRSLNSYI